MHQGRREREREKEESNEGASGNAEIKVDRCFCKAAQSFNKDRIAEREGREDRRAIHTTYHTPQFLQAITSALILTLILPVEDFEPVVVEGEGADFLEAAEHAPLRGVELAPRRTEVLEAVV